MNPSREAPWSEDEKVYLLAEILKAGSIPSSTLFRIVDDAKIVPNWANMPLPQGRSLNSCKAVFEALVQAHRQTYNSGPVAQPFLGPLPEIPRKRTFTSDTSTPAGRAIAPKSAYTYPSDYMSAHTYLIPPFGEPPNKKKRGRPTKKEAEAKAAAAAERGEVYPPPKPAKKERTSLPTEDVAPSSSTPSSSFIAHRVVTTPPIPPNIETSSETSGGKRKRGRPTKSEVEMRRLSTTEADAPGFSSPSRRAGTSREAPGQTEAQSTTAAIGPPVAHESRDTAMAGMEDTGHRRTIPHSYRETVGM